MNNNKFKRWLMIGIIGGIFMFSLSCYLFAVNNPLAYFFLSFGGITGIVCGIVRGNIFGREKDRW